MKTWIKYSLLISILCVLSSCSFDISSKATEQQQKQLKNQVLSLIEKEYHQPFKLLDFKYNYEFHNEYSFLYVIFRKYGNYHFKIQAVNNPIIVMDFNFNDGLATKESIKPLIDSFKKNQLNGLYCGLGLVNHYVNTKRTLNDKLTPEEIKANNYCDSRGQKAKYDNAWTR